MAKSELTLEIKARLQQALSELNEVSDALEEIEGDSRQASDGMSDLKDEMEAMGGVATRVMAGVGAAMGGAVAAFASFETQSTNVQNITEMTAEEMAVLEQRILQLPPALGEADDLMAGLYQTISSGITEPEEAFNVIITSAKAAKGNLADLTQTVDASTSIMNAYGLESSEVTEVLDAMTKTVDLGKLTFADLSNNIGKGVSIAASAGVQYEELFSILATLTLNGLSVEEAMTAVRNILLVGLKPTEQVRQGMEELGVDLSAAALQAKGFGGWMADAATAVQGNAEMTAMLFPNIRALNGAMKLASTEGGEKYQQVLDGISDSSGKVNRNFERMTDTVKGQTAIMVTELKKLGIEFGELAAEDIVPLLQAGGDLVKWLRDLNPDTKDQVILMGELAFAWGAVVLAGPKVVGALIMVRNAIQATGDTAFLATPKITAMFAALNVGVAAGIAANMAINAVADAIDRASNELEEASVAGAREMDAFMKAAKNLDIHLGDLGETLGTGVTPALIDELKALKEANRISSQHSKLLVEYDRVLKGIADERENATEGQEELNEETEVAVERQTALGEAIESATGLLKDNADVQERLAENTRAFNGVLDTMGTELGLVAEVLEDGTVVWLRSMKDIIEGDTDPRFLDGVSGAVENLGTQIQLTDQFFDDLVMALGTELTPEAPDFALWHSEINQLGEYFRDSLGFSIMDGLMTMEDFGDFFEGLVDEWASYMTDIWGGAISEAFEGGDLGSLGGNIMANIQDNQGMFTLAGIATVYNATQQEDQGVATIQGAIGGAQIGASAGGWVGAIVGAVLGGAAGYFGSEGEDITTRLMTSEMERDRMFRGFSLGGHDISMEEEEVMVERIRAAYADFEMMYLDTIRAFGDASLIDGLGGSIPMFGINQVFDMQVDTFAEWLVGTWMPEAFEQTFRPAFEQGFSNLGVSSSTQEELFRMLSRRTGDDRLEGLQTFIEVLVNGAEMMENMDWETVVQTATEGPRDVFTNFMEEGLGDLELMYAGIQRLDILQASEQFATMQETIMGASQATGQYVQQLLQLQEQLQAGIASQREALFFGGLDTAGQADYLGAQIQEIFGQLAAGGLDPNEASMLTQQAQGYIAQLEQLFGEDIDEDMLSSGFLSGLGIFNADFLSGLDIDPGETGREFLIQLLDQLSGLTDAALQESLDEAEQLNQQYLDWLVRVNEELANFTEMLGGLRSQTDYDDLPGDGDEIGDNDPEDRIFIGPKMVEAIEGVANAVAATQSPIVNINVDAQAAQLVSIIRSVVYRSLAKGGSLS